MPRTFQQLIFKRELEELKDAMRRKRATTATTARALIDTWSHEAILELIIERMP